MAALLRFAARKVCGHAGLERPLQGSFMAARSIAVVKEEEPRKLPWTIFHGRLRSLQWFSSTPESPYDPLTNNHKHFPVSLGTRGLEEKRQELLRLLREMDDLQAERCTMEIKKNTKLLQLLGRPPSKPWSAEDFKRHFGVYHFQDFILSLPAMACAVLHFVVISMMTIFILLSPFFLLYEYCTSTSRTGQKYKEHTLSEKDLAATKE
ncbi:uncharacterized protein LOC125549376 [Triticum urartu]|uniref:Uncharacterized protein n=2 Tax=Triticum turgidum subsp. durum TaxID=4567 RepID=A0A9R0VUI9_TRITD|nr:uncharacterized protein LOC125549376 [Triticum urartu]VAH69551.1 unnamed protein product [Triticum turgidum subsp. durum]